MANTIKPADLGAAISQGLELYADDVAERVNDCGRVAVKKLVKLTKGSAPVGATGEFKRSITSREDDASHGMKKFTWYVRPPNHRLTHLLVHGHVTPTGGRTKASPFLQNALDQVLPEYEHDIEEAVKND